ncbi:uncharacterized protein J8A68_001627 [[Candida] subhashii]|uniref:Choline kinase N-terminal domain-containing protein n=1 Tax=[Candida] subhashii TaxID=561895 RepID=A0A8J5QNM8_9ASCO|nr:uncharacterized protein J8A68_001627 [[Candida] subhashii]KAG7664869.1 hypothetical protein J8A68_001627 [[Candida] subhashii]
MEVIPIVSRPSRSKSRTSANSRSGSRSRRSSSSRPRSLSASSLTKLVVTPTHLDERTVPSVHATLDNTLPLDFFKQDILALIKTLRVSKWHKRQLTISNLIINRISGALTNSIYKLEYIDKQQNLTLPALLLRVYGRNVDALIDRDAELANLVKLSQKKIGPRLLGIFSNGRFEQFLEGFVTLNKEKIRDPVISQMLGRRMKDLHYQIELDEEDLTPLPSSWRLIEKWMKMFEETYIPSYKAAGLDPKSIFWVEFDQFKQLVAKYKSWLFNKYDTDAFTANYKFCHNDTQYGNLLLHESFKPEEVILDSSTNSSSAATSFASLKDVNFMATSHKKDANLAVIDFEYSGPNFPALDIANHFSEWMSDYYHPTKSYFIFHENYPTKLEQFNLLKSYIEYDFQYPSSNLKTSKRPEDIINDNKNAVDIIQYEIEKIYNECVFWRTTVQIYWCLWGLIQNGPLPSPTPMQKEDSKSEPGIDGTYTITQKLECAILDDEDSDTTIDGESAITSSDDEFDYIKYSNQKIALVMGDLIQFGLMDKNEIDKENWDLIKYLDCSLFDL